MDASLWPSCIAAAGNNPYAAPPPTPQHPFGFTAKNDSPPMPPATCVPVLDPSFIAQLLQRQQLQQVFQQQLQQTQVQQQLQLPQQQQQQQQRPNAFAFASPQSPPRAPFSPQTYSPPPPPPSPTLIPHAASHCCATGVVSANIPACTHNQDAACCVTCWKNFTQEVKTVVRTLPIGHELKVLVKSDNGNSPVPAVTRHFCRVTHGGEVVCRLKRRACKGKQTRGIAEHERSSGMCGELFGSSVGIGLPPSTCREKVADSWWMHVATTRHHRVELLSEMGLFARPAQLISAMWPETPPQQPQPQPAPPLPQLPASLASAFFSSAPGCAASVLPISANMLTPQPITPMPPMTPTPPLDPLPPQPPLVAAAQALSGLSYGTASTSFGNTFASPSMGPDFMSPPNQPLDFSPCQNSRKRQRNRQLRTTHPSEGKIIAEILMERDDVKIMRKVVGGQEIVVACWPTNDSEELVCRSGLPRLVPSMVPELDTLLFASLRRVVSGFHVPEAVLALRKAAEYAPGSLLIASSLAWCYWACPSCAMDMMPMKAPIDLDVLDTLEHASESEKNEVEAFLVSSGSSGLAMLATFVLYVRRDLRRATALWSHAAAIGHASGQRAFAVRLIRGDPDAHQFLLLEHTKQQHPQQQQQPARSRTQTLLLMQQPQSVSNLQQAILLQQQQPPLPSDADEIQQHLQEQLNAVSMLQRVKNEYGSTQQPPEDYPQALRLLRAAAESGDVPARAWLGYCYEAGLGVRKSWEKAAKNYRIASEKGYAEAQCSLAWCYEKGFGVKRNLEKAEKWYTAAANMGFADAQRRLAWIKRRKGEFLAGLKLLFMAAQQGHQMGMIELHDWCQAASHLSPCSGDAVSSDEEELAGLVREATTWLQSAAMEASAASIQMQRQQDLQRRYYWNKSNELLSLCE
eukprot:TRINITY_DN296_c0_g1_i8.p1 TRINITY_DN296_c0_g1~~TRINITY_DN296_c0_g1_i8.p1  ORF type:complete len:915 (+),score=257.58 TRINITY_DN296_c0_g1_i8:58-2802(+)